MNHYGKRNTGWSGTTGFSITWRDASGGEASRSMTSDNTSGEAAHKKKALVTWMRTLLLVHFDYSFIVHQYLGR